MRSMKCHWRMAGLLIAMVVSTTLVGAVRAHSGSHFVQVDNRADVDRQRPEQPTLSTAERMQLAFPGFQPGGEITGAFPGRLMNKNFEDWPPMLHIGDSAEIAGKTFTVKEILLVSGSDHPMAYEPTTGRKRLAPEGLRTNLLDFSKNTEVFIPPNSTLVMVSIDVEPEAIERPPGQAGCETPGERDFGNFMRVSYRTLGEVSVIRSSSDENFGTFASPTMYCLSSGWLYFHVFALDVDQDQLWFEIIDEESRLDIAIWSLKSLLE